MSGHGFNRLRLPDRTGAGASAIVASSEPVMTLILIDDPAMQSTEAEPLLDVSPRGIEPQDALVKVASPDPFPAAPLPAPDEADAAESAVAEAAGNQAQRALLFGRYLGQISARIERAWIRPRSAVEPGSDARFRCQVEIQQNGQGEVQQVTLQWCNGDTRWQMSLVHAIQTASPLPAPPDPSAFVNIVTMSFESPEYLAGGSEQGFEPASIALAMLDRTNP